MTTISTTARPAYVYDESEDTWYPVGAQAIAFVTTYVYTATASQTVFSGADDNSQTLSYTTGAVKVFLNGALLTPTLDYSALNGTSVILTSGASLDDILVIVAADTYQDANVYTKAEVDLIESTLEGTISDLDGEVVALGEDVVDLKASSMIIVSHGTDPNYARPTGVGAVYWIGSAEPVNAEAYDMWWSV
jgi:hypothetical protein